jgi:hypothetical protein
VADGLDDLRRVAFEDDAGRPIVAAGHAIDAIASKLMHLDKPDRRAVWAFVSPLVEEALDGD